ncbi:MAG TPA: AprI/Inh family metalloprotease inhibitor [Rhizomicrobium sp.]|jgi:hypothetical protein|nr:AprI/Inh family metalloprotease inhibitor [Rhizomicrobium sp.]
MMSLRTVSLASALVFAAASAAQADSAAGSYKLGIGATASCAITLAADGTASYASDCAQGGDVAKWQAKYNGVELQTARGETVALLKGKNGSYSGTRFADGRSLTLNADTAAVASNH